MAFQRWRQRRSRGGVYCIYKMEEVVFRRGGSGVSRGKKWYSSVGGSGVPEMEEMAIQRWRKWCSRGGGSGIPELEEVALYR